MVTSEEKKHILIAEDSATQAQMLKESLSKLGYKVSVASDGKEAWDQFCRHRPHLVISDINMPKMDGYQLCAAIKRQAPTLPVVLLTAMREVEDVIRGLQAGADNYLFKPCPPEYLSQRIEALLNIETDPKEDTAVTVPLGKKTYKITANRRQILNLLLSVFENAVEQNRRLEQSNRELQQAQEKLIQINARLEDLNRQKDELIGMAAHDLRSPLNAILGYSQVGLERFGETADPVLVRFLRSIARSSEKMLQLVNDLLDVSALESGSLTLHLEEVDLNSLIHSCVELVQAIADRKNITIETVIPTQLPKLLADGPKLEQVITNLLTNAVKFSHPNTKVRISASATQTGITVEVEDKGQGIPARDQLKLFRPFIKTSVKATAGESSIGLGLAIAKKIIEGHGGTIWVNSEVGKGSVFSFSIPLRQKSTP